MSQAHRRRNAGLRHVFRQPEYKPPEPERKLWPASNPADAVEWWQNRLEKPLFVYFIQDDRGPIKIGKAHHPRSRLAELQCGNPVTLQFRAVVLADANTERRLHQLWKGFCVSGEWFGLDHAPQLVELSQRVQRQQIDAFKRNKPIADIQAMPLEGIRPDIHVAARVVLGL